MISKFELLKKMRVSISLLQTGELKTSSLLFHCFPNIPHFPKMRFQIFNWPPKPSRERRSGWGWEASRRTSHDPTKYARILATAASSAPEDTSSRPESWIPPPSEFCSTPPHSPSQHPTLPSGIPDASRTTETEADLLLCKRSTSTVRSD